MRGDNELKRRIKRSLTFVRNRVCRLTVVQKFLVVTLALLRRSSLTLKLKLSIALQRMLQLKTKTVTVLLYALHSVKRALHIMNVHTLKHRKQTVIAVAVSAISVLNLFFFATISGQLFVRTNMYSYGTVQIQSVGVAAYTDASCVARVSDVAWGSLAPGSSATNVIYLKNEGTTSLTLSLNTASWSPTSAANYITLNWNYNGQPIAPDQVVPVTLTLSVSPNIDGISYFGFEIVIDGTS